jgi:hypothetical protein
MEMGLSAHEAAGPILAAFVGLRTIERMIAAAAGGQPPRPALRYLRLKLIFP